MKSADQSSPFRDLRLAAGYKSTPIAKALGVSLGTVWCWDQGDRPRWRYMPELAQFFGVDLAEIVDRLWGERIGDPCQCGCSGKKASPKQQKAYNLAIELPCTVCGKIRSYQGREHLHSRVLCNRCTAAKRRVDRIELTCVGYMLYNARNPRYAKTCPGKTEMLRSRLKYWSRYRRTVDDELQRPFVNERVGKYRCERCWYGFQVIKFTEEKVRRFLLKVNPHRTVPRINSLKQLRELQKRCYKLRTYNPNLLNSQRTYKPGRRGSHIVQIKGSLSWRAKTSPNVVKGLCIVCDKLLFSYNNTKPPKAHRKCSEEYMSTKLRAHPRDKTGRLMNPIPVTISNPPRRRGGQVTTKNLAKHFSWAIRHKLGGESLHDIAQENGISAPAVKKNVDHVMKYLPDPQLVRPGFRLRLSLLLDAKNSALQSQDSD